MKPLTKDTLKDQTTLKGESRIEYIAYTLKLITTERRQPLYKDKMAGPKCVLDLEVSLVASSKKRK